MLVVIGYHFVLNYQGFSFSFFLFQLLLCFLDFQLDFDAIVQQHLLGFDLLFSPWWELAQGAWKVVLFPPEQMQGAKGCPTGCLFVLFCFFFLSTVRL